MHLINKKGHNKILRRFLSVFCLISYCNYDYYRKNISPRQSQVRNCGTVHRTWNGVIFVCVLALVVWTATWRCVIVADVWPLSLSRHSYTLKHTCWCKRSQSQAPWPHLSCFLIDQVQPNNGCVHVCFFCWYGFISVIFQSPVSLSVLDSLFFYFKVLSLWLCLGQIFESAHSFTHTASDCNCGLCLYYSYGESKETGHMRLFALDPHNSTTVIFPVFQECWSHDPSF